MSDPVVDLEEMGPGAFLTEEMKELCRFTEEEVRQLNAMSFNLSTLVIQTRTYVEKRKVQKTVKACDHVSTARGLLTIAHCCVGEEVDPILPVRIAIGG